MAEQDIVERLRNGKSEVYQAIAELRKWADWYVSCACGNVPDEAAAAYLLIEEFDRIDVALTEERSAYIMSHGVFQTEALRSKNEVDKLTTENASLRQQLAEARETARREALEEVNQHALAARYRRLHDACRRILWTDLGVPAMENEQTKSALSDLAEIVFMDALIAADRALPHTDREGERE